MFFKESTAVTNPKLNFSFKHLRTICLIAIMATSTLFAQAQKKKKYEYNKETGFIELSGQNIAKLDKIKADLLGTQKNYSLKSLDGEELLFVKFYQTTRYNRQTGKEENTNWFKFSFIESGGQLDIKKAVTLSTSGFLKILAQHDLLTKNGQIKNSSLEALMLKYNGRYTKTNKTNTTSHTEVEVIDGEIHQNGNLIGKVIEASDSTSRIYHVYRKTGSKVCMATIAKENPLEWKLEKPDGAVYTVLYEGKGDGLQILTYLASEGWFK